MEQRSCNGFHPHNRSVLHRRTSGAAQLHLFTCTACRRSLITGPVEQHSCNGFHLHCRSVPHRRTSRAAQLRWFSPALQVGPHHRTSGAAQLHWFLHALRSVPRPRTSGAAQLHWFSPALQVGPPAPPDQWSSTAASVFTCTSGRFRVAGPVEQQWRPRDVSTPRNRRSLVGLKVRPPRLAPASPTPLLREVLWRERVAIGGVYSRNKIRIWFEHLSVILSRFVRKIPELYILYNVNLVMRAVLGV